MTVTIKTKAELEQEALEAWRSSCKVTPAQAKRALLRAGLLDEVEAIMADENTDREIKIAWEYSATFDRSSDLIEALQSHPTIDLTDEQVDDIFRTAKTIG
tara:strand:+ start:347 stop:649 length:303 start_codon:yes stop_codon:yes gene_type:complete